MNTFTDRPPQPWDFSDDHFLNPKLHLPKIQNPTTQNPQPKNPPKPSCSLPNNSHLPRLPTTTTPHPFPNFTSEPSAQSPLQKLRTLSDQPLALDSDLSDFEEKVRENKLMIKNEMIRKKAEFRKKRKKIAVGRNESLYERRVRDYTDTMENKYLLQKKRQVGKKGGKEVVVGVIRVQDGGEADRKMTKLEKIQKHVNDTPARQLLKPTTMRLQDASAKLFDSIHTILKHPHKCLALKKAKSLKLFTTKPSSPPQPQQQAPCPPAHFPTQPPIKNPSTFNALAWQRISINPQLLIQNVQSSFNNQLERIDKLIVRNEKSIESFVRNRQELIEIEVGERLRGAVVAVVVGGGGEG